MTIRAALSRLNRLTPKPLSRWKVAIGLALLTLGALVVHGYHPYAEDAEIYLPGVEKILSPSLFPTGTEFFENHASLTLFPHLMVASVRIFHLPLAFVLFGWQIASLFLLSLAVWKLSGICFDNSRARWAAVALMASLLTLPIAGTALYILDPYLNPRNLAAFTAVFALAYTLQKKYIIATLWLLFAALVHPLMSSFAISFCILLVILARWKQTPPALPALLALPNLFLPTSPAYHEAMHFHSNHLILTWQWYEWLGIIGPVPIFGLASRMARRRRWPVVVLLCRAAIIYDLASFAAALVVSVPTRLEALSRIQPLRSLQLVYMLLIVISAGLLAEYVLKDRVWRWMLLFVPLCIGMFWAQRSLFAGSSQVEWPWAAYKNRWEQAFVWIQQNTPNGAIFAIDPMYITFPGEDTDGFRAIAERSRLADAYKDSGAVSMFPPLADEWWEQFQAQKNWNNFKNQDFEQLRRKYGVTWVVLQAPNAKGMKCPYSNPAVLVCAVGE